MEKKDAYTFHTDFDKVFPGFSEKVQKMMVGRGYSELFAKDCLEDGIEFLLVQCDFPDGLFKLNQEETYHVYIRGCGLLSDVILNVGIIHHTQMEFETMIKLDTHHRLFEIVHHNEDGDIATVIEEELLCVFKRME